MSIAKKTELNFRFHNPNTVEKTAEYIEKIFIEVNKKKLEQILQEEWKKADEKKEQNHEQNMG